MNSIAQFEAYRALRHRFFTQMGYGRLRDIPDDLVRSLAQFCDTYSSDMMTGYYASQLILHFYRKRSKDGWDRLQSSLAEHLQRKMVLIDIFASYTLSTNIGLPFESVRVETLWSAIADREDGYELANLIGRYCYLFTQDILELAFQRASSMPDTFRVRALGGLLPEMNEEIKLKISDFLIEKLAEGSYEAAYQLKLRFQLFDRKTQSEIVSAFLILPNAYESSVAYLVIRNAKNLCSDDALRLANRARGFDSGYLKNRSLLKLSHIVPMSEIKDLYERFIDCFMEGPASVGAIHNLYQFSAALGLNKDSVINMALKRIAQLEDSSLEMWNQSKYGQLLFIAPHLDESHRQQALEIARTVRGGYGKALVKKLERHFKNEVQFCTYRFPAICY